jgi:RecT family protein
MNNTPARIDAPLDRRNLGEMSVDKFAGLTFKDYQDAIDFAKVVTHAKYGLPAFLRNNASDCLIITTQALRWRLEPVWVMQQAYITKADGIINYDNFVFGAVLMASGLAKGRPRYSYAGQGEARTCTISVTFKDETEPYTYTTPPLKVCKKNSPLWVTDPDQQLGYYAIRSFTRRYIPELLGGVYSNDEFEDSTKEAVGPTGSEIDRRRLSTTEALDMIAADSVAKRAAKPATHAPDDEPGESGEVIDQGEYADSDDELPLGGKDHEHHDRA